MAYFLLFILLEFAMVFLFEMIRGEHLFLDLCEHDDIVIRLTLLSLFLHFLNKYCLCLLCLLMSLFILNNQYLDFLWFLSIIQIHRSVLISSLGIHLHLLNVLNLLNLLSLLGKFLLLHYLLYYQIVLVCGIRILTTNWTSHIQTWLTGHGNWLRLLDVYIVWLWYTLLLSLVRNNWRFDFNRYFTLWVI